MKDFVMQSGFSPVLVSEQKRAAAQSGQTMHPAPSHDDIARRAYDIYIKRGSKPGHCRQNWLQAEQDLKNQSQAGSHRNDSRHENSPAPSAGSTSESQFVGQRQRSSKAKGDDGQRMPARMDDRAEF